MSGAPTIVAADTPRCGGVHRSGRAAGGDGVVDGVIERPLGPTASIPFDSLAYEVYAANWHGLPINSHIKPECCQLGTAFRDSTMLAIRG